MPGGSVVGVEVYSYGGYNQMPMVQRRCNTCHELSTQFAIFLLESMQKRDIGTSFRDVPLDSIPPPHYQYHLTRSNDKGALTYQATYF